MSGSPCVRSRLRALGLLTLDSDARLAIITTTIAILVCLSIVVLTGYVGQISLAPSSTRSAMSLKISLIGR